MSDNHFSVVSLFSGAGGLDIGFENTGLFKAKVCVDYEVDCINTLRLNKDHGLKTGTHSYLSDCSIEHADLSKPAEVLKHLGRENVDVVIGGPPCQSFSVAGKRGGTSDIRGGLISSYIECVSLIHPKAFVLENVPGIVTVENGAVLKYILDRSSEMGYSIWSGKLCAADYGDPTLRIRYFIIAVREPVSPIRLPKVTHQQTNTCASELIVETDLEPYKTVEEALCGLPYMNDALCPINGHTIINHKPEVISRFEMLKPGERDEARRRNRLNPSQPSLTLFSGGIKGKKQARSHIHPYFPRELTPRECARLHSFPDYWMFSGGHDSMLTQISNSVPIKLGEAVAREVMNALGFNENG